MSKTIKINVVGIGYKPLDRGASEAVTEADTIIASKRLAEVFKGYDEFNRSGGKVRVINNVDEAIGYIKAVIADPQSSATSLVFLASGDPLFFGIGRRMVNEFGKDNVEIHPDLSCIQAAFSRIKEPWDNAFLISVHGGPDPQKRRALKYDIPDIPLLIEKHSKLCILTDKVNSPQTIALEFLKRAAAGYQSSGIRMYVCERLGYPDEKITEGSPDDISCIRFSDPNVVIIQNQSSGAVLRLPVLGLAEDDITHSRGLITKDEIRAVTIHKLKLPHTGVLWDIGAGSGSVSIEAARLCPGLSVFAIEKDREQLSHLKENRTRFRAWNIEIICGEAPDSLSQLPQPDRVFIGGSNRRLAGIMEVVSSNESAKVVVINAATIETLNEAIGHLERCGFSVDISGITASRSKVVAGKRHLNSLNPVFIVRGGRD